MVGDYNMLMFEIFWKYAILLSGNIGVCVYIYNKSMW